MFGQNNLYQEELISLLLTSIKERQNEICDTWDAVKVMALPWGVKEELEPQAAEGLKSHLETILDTVLQLNDEFKVKILKADVKERKGRYLMILRYQIET